MDREEYAKNYKALTGRNLEDNGHTGPCWKQGPYACGCWNQIAEHLDIGEQMKERTRADKRLSENKER